MKTRSDVPCEPGSLIFSSILPVRSGTLIGMLHSIRDGKWLAASKTKAIFHNLVLPAVSLPVCRHQGAVLGVLEFFKPPIPTNTMRSPGRTPGRSHKKLSPSMAVCQSYCTEPSADPTTNVVILPSGGLGEFAAFHQCCSKGKRKLQVGVKFRFIPHLMQIKAKSTQICILTINFLPFKLYHPVQVEWSEMVKSTWIGMQLRCILLSVSQQFAITPVRQ